jgi:YbgC/YbaW family acyl-CoA thioester hydrolase
MKPEEMKPKEMKQEARIFVYQLQILERHLDTFGHVNNAVYLDIFEEARWDFITKNGYGLDYIKQTQIGPVILEANIKYKKEVKNREWIQIFSQSRPGKHERLIEIEQILKNDKDQICCQANFITGVFDLQKRCLIQGSSDWLKAIGMISHENQ